MRARQILQISGLLLLCLFLLSACDAVGRWIPCVWTARWMKVKSRCPSKRVMASLPVPPPTSGRNRRRGIYISL